MDGAIQQMEFMLNRKDMAETVKRDSVKEEEEMCDEEEELSAEEASDDLEDKQHGEDVSPYLNTAHGGFTCTLCHYTTASYQMYQEHMKVHSGIKPYCCQYCPFSSEFRSSLLRHIKRHTHANEKPYRCGRCSYQSRYKWNVTVHMRKCHDKDNNYRHMLQAQSPNDLQGLPRISNVFSGNPSSELSSSEISSSPESMPTSVNITCASASNSIVVDKGVENQNKQTASIDDRNDRDFRPGSILEAAAQRKLMEFTHIQSVYTSTPISHTVQRKSIDNASFTQPDSVSISSASQPGFDTPIYSLSMPMASINARPKQAASLVQHVDKNHSPPIVPVSLRVTPQLLEKNPAKDRLVSESCQTEQVENPDCSCSNMKSCNHCGTFFTDNVIYTLHMSCHGNRNPFQCGICGYECRDKIEFTCHITRSQHKK